MEDKQVKISFILEYCGTPRLIRITSPVELLTRNAGICRHKHQLTLLKSSFVIKDYVKYLCLPVVFLISNKFLIQTIRKRLCKHYINFKQKSRKAPPLNGSGKSYEKEISKMILKIS
jgi:hypothetical protein